MTRERQDEERRRKIEEFRESNQRALQFRRKQEDQRQQKILESRQRETDRRMTVEERRKKLFQEENVSGIRCRGEALYESCHLCFSHLSIINYVPAHDQCNNSCLNDMYTVNNIY